MKIEKINDNQIRCTLTNEDLIDRELKITELAYGTDKAKKLFHDMMQQASNEFGFEAENIPLMIEAIPLNADSIVLVITKVEDPDELDTRFSKFSPSIHADDENIAHLTNSELEECKDEVLDLFKKIQDILPTASAKNTDTASNNESVPVEQNESTTKEKKIPNLTKVYSFNSFDKLLYATSLLNSNLVLSSALYKDNIANAYILLIESEPVANKDFIHLFHTLSEYSDSPSLPPTLASAYYSEHCTVLLKENALTSLAGITE